MHFKAAESMVAEPPPRSNGHLFVAGASPVMRSLERVIADIAPTDIPVLLLGESGTGKEVVALQIHRLSQRRAEPFVKMSCAALTPESFNGRLHHPEASGAVSGTLFLDEISQLDAACQPKLLHVLPDGDDAG
ncbi:MAG: sigma-54 factor interaction domain-containing protein, partial [Acidobacteriales bacterium]|nr:sigma-54 factor interaction domain-containing protein [Terriglobales bacterium]